MIHPLTTVPLLIELGPASIPRPFSLTPPTLTIPAPDPLRERERGAISAAPLLLAARLSNLLRRDEMDTGASSSSFCGEPSGESELMFDVGKWGRDMDLASHRLLQPCLWRRAGDLRHGRAGSRICSLVCQIFQASQLDSENKQGSW